MSDRSTYYCTTAITYANAKPHLGHAYEEIATDVLARWHRCLGREVLFSTGSDEHSVNVETKAKDLGQTPLAYCTEMAAVFERTWRALDISYDRFLRTSEPIHHRAAQEMVRRAQAAGDIYRGHYEGWYCNSCETYYLETDLKAMLCPVHGIQPVWLSEENYFFRLSRYAPALQSHIETHPEFVQPETRRNEVLNIIKGGLKDISVSRSGSTWGIPFPDAPGHIIYVWFDALINYLSAAGFPDDPGTFARFWPADLHVIGKDITRFHCIIWPAMLLSAQLPLPRRVFGHGFLSLKGEKISKTRGNVLDPLELVSTYGVDAVRYILLAATSFSGDADFSEQDLIDRFNSDLANDLGNLLNRTLTMAEKFCSGRVPSAGVVAAEDTPLRTAADQLFTTYRQAMEQLDFNRALGQVLELVKRANKYIDQTAPWALNQKGQQERLDSVLYHLLEALRLAAVFLWPFMPNTTPRMLAQLGDPEPHARPSFPAAAQWGGLPAGQVLAKAAPLFPRIEKPKVQG